MRLVPGRDHHEPHDEQRDEERQRHSPRLRVRHDPDERRVEEDRIAGHGAGQRTVAERAGEREHLRAMMLQAPLGEMRYVVMLGVVALHATDEGEVECRRAET